MNKRLTITITLEEDAKTIALVKVNGCVHNMYEESPEEKQRYLNMCVRDFISDYAHYYESAQAGELGNGGDADKPYYVVRIKGQYYFSLDEFVPNIEEACICEYSRAVYVRESIIQDHEAVEDVLNFTFKDEDIELVRHNPAAYRTMRVLVKNIARQLCDGLDKTEAEIEQCERWLAEYGIAHQLSLYQLNELCWEDSDWVLNQIFG